MKVIFAADHAGFALKNSLVEYVRDELGYAVEDYGAHEHNPDDDYPDLMYRVATAVSRGTAEDIRGIILGGSGQGEAIVANRIPGIRAVVYYGTSTAATQDSSGATLDMLTATRTHNDANILSLGARFISEEEARDAVRTWLATPFSGDERHRRRIKKLDT